MRLLSELRNQRKRDLTVVMEFRGSMYSISFFVCTAKRSSRLTLLVFVLKCFLENSFIETVESFPSLFK